jgi:histidinol phosphatase-like enzyme
LASNQNGDIRGYKNHQQQQSVDTAMIAQLEQANRSLHRQVEEYKRLVEQMKLDIIKPSKSNEVISEAKYNTNLILPGLLDLSNKSIIRERSSMKSMNSNLKEVRTEKAHS